MKCVNYYLNKKNRHKILVKQLPIETIQQISFTNILCRKQYLLFYFPNWMIKSITVATPPRIPT